MPVAAAVLVISVVVIMAVTMNAPSTRYVGKNVVATCQEARATRPDMGCMSIIVGKGPAMRLVDGESLTVPVTFLMTQTEGGNFTTTLHLLGNGTSQYFSYLLDNGTSFYTNRFMAYSNSSLTVGRGQIGHTVLTITIPSKLPNEILKQGTLLFYIEWTSPDSQKIFSAATSVEVNVS